MERWVDAVQEGIDCVLRDGHLVTICAEPRRFSAPGRWRRMSPANIVQNRFHHTHIVSWRFSILCSNSRSST
ncbi:hypothetical protein [Sphingomonas faeni]|uniref:hypothetical protein n=1 Tax=Sphingomonas faeni TaxID=185950 RepID=UPI00335A1A98